MATAGSIVIDILARTGSFETDTKRAEAALAKFTKSAKQAGVAIGTALAAGATAAAVALKSTIDRMDELSKSAQKVGLPTEELSKLNYAAGLADVSLETLTGSLGKLTKAQAAALNASSQQAKVFDALGISIKKADGSLRNSADILADFADVFAAMKGSPEAMAAGFALFGRSFQDLVPLIKDGSGAIREAGAELESFGGIVSTEAGQAAEEFNDNVTRLKTAAQGLAIQVASDLLPDMVDLTDRMVDWSKEGSKAKEIADDIREAFRVLSTMVDVLGSTLVTIDATVRGLTSDFIALFHAMSAAGKARVFDFSGAAEDWEKARLAFGMGQEQSRRIEDTWRRTVNGTPAATPEPRVTFITGSSGARDESTFARSRGQIDAEKRAAEMEKRLQAAFAGNGKSKGKAGKSDAEKEAEALARAFEAANERLKEQLALFGSTTEAAQVYYDVTQGSLAKLEPAQKKILLDQAAELDLMRQRREELDKEIEARKKAEDAAKRQAESVQDLLADIEFERSLLGRSIEDQEIMNNLRWAGVDANSAYGQSIIEATKALQEQREKTEDQIEVMDGLRDSARGFFDDVRDGANAWDAARDAFGRFADALWDWAASGVIDMVFGRTGTTGQGSSGGGWLGGLIGSFFGGSSGGSGEAAGSLVDLFSGSFMGGFAGGGSAMAGHAYLVGEQGPELFVPRTAGAVLPADETQLRMGGGGDTYSPTFNFLLPRRVDNRSQMQVAQAADRGGREASMRNGGRRG